MLRQSNRFWVVDMQGTSSSSQGGDGDESGSIPMQIFVLVDKVGQQSKGTRLGDQLSMHGESDALRQWKARRATGTLRRPVPVQQGAEELDVHSEVVGFPSEGGAAPSRESPVLSYASHYASSEGELRPAEQVACIQLPRRAHTETRLSALLDTLEPSVSGVDSRLGLRQMHVAWSQNCTCAASAVVAMGRLRVLQGQAKGRQVRRLEEQIRSFADVVQSGVSSLGVQQLAQVLRAVQGRQGYDNLVKFAANRLLQGDISVAAEARSLVPSDVAMMVEAFGASSQRDVALYRKLAGICMQMPPSGFSVDDIAHILEGFEKGGVRDKSLMRHMASILQSGPPKTFTARGIGSLASSLVSGGALEDAFRALSAAAQKLPNEDFTPESLGVIWTAFAMAEIRDPPLYRYLSQVARKMDGALFDAETVARISRAAAKCGMPAGEGLFAKLAEVAISLRCSAYTPETAARIVAAFADGAPQSDRLFKYLALVIKKMDGWTFDIDTVAMIVAAYKRSSHMDTSLFARLSTILQQVPPPPSLPLPTPLCSHTFLSSSSPLSLSFCFSPHVLGDVDNLGASDPQNLLCLGRLPLCSLECSLD